MTNPRIAGFIVPWASDLIRKAEEKTRREIKEGQYGNLRTFILSAGIRRELDRVQRKWTSQICTLAFVPSFFQNSVLWFRRV
jgi:hypothetical protein